MQHLQSEQCQQERHIHHPEHRMSEPADWQQLNLLCSEAPPVVDILVRMEQLRALAKLQQSNGRQAKRRQISFAF